jgi:hypothetical protein
VVKRLLAPGALALLLSALPSAGSPFDPVVEVDILTLTTIDWEPGDPLPEEITALSGQRVLIRGYMHGSIVDDTQRFPLVSDACQCVGVLMPHHFVDVLLEEDETGPIQGQFEVLGRFNVGPREDEDGFVTSVYRLRGEIY